ncbi:MAG: hypothetical protein OXE78_12945 [Gammaproteobacteria bacterium]|nr:hypothetical protein [Gammaproteobacteria bacterium]
MPVGPADFVVWTVYLSGPGTKAQARDVMDGISASEVCRSQWVSCWLGKQLHRRASG